MSTFPTDPVGGGTQSTQVTGTNLKAASTVNVAASTSAAAAATAAGRGTQGTDTFHTEMTKLADAKDRAQLSATSAMSIINVGMLREVIRLGSTFSMYVPLLILISISIVLQITAGALSILLSNMRSDYQKFKTSTCKCKGKTYLLCGCCRGDDTAGEQVALSEAKTLQLAFDNAGATFAPESETGRHDSPKTTTAAREDHIVTVDKSETEADDVTNPEITVMAGDDVPGSGSKLRKRYQVGEPVAATNPDASKSKQLGLFTPQEYHDKLVSRLLALVNDMLETEDQRIETKLIIPFLDKETDNLKAKLNELKQEELDSTKDETHLSQEKLAAAARLEQLQSAPQSPDRETTNETGQGSPSSPQDADKDVASTSSSANDRDKPDRKVTSPPQNGSPAFEEAKTRLSDIDTRMQRHREKTQGTSSAIRQVERSLTAITEERNNQTKRQQLFAIDEEKLAVYRQMLSDSQQRAYLKRVTFWQHVINYVLYCVFVLNAFITAFSFLSDDE